MNYSLLQNLIVQLNRLFFTTTYDHALPANEIYNALTNQTILMKEYSDTVYSRVNKFYIDFV